MPHKQPKINKLILLKSFQLKWRITREIPPFNAVILPCLALFVKEYQECTLPSQNLPGLPIDKTVISCYKFIWERSQKVWPNEMSGDTDGFH